MTTEQRIGHRFLELQAEIRNHIYQEALVSLDMIDVDGQAPCIREPALLATCKEVRNDARAMFYG